MSTIVNLRYLLKYCRERSCIKWLLITIFLKFIESLNRKLSQYLYLEFPPQGFFYINSNKWLFWKVREKFQENIHGIIFFLILSTKTLCQGCFLCKFLKYFSGALTKKVKKSRITCLLNKIVGWISRNINRKGLNKTVFLRMTQKYLID